MYKISCSFSGGCMEDTRNNNFSVGDLVVYTPKGGRAYFGIVVGLSLLWKLIPGYHCNFENPVFICYFISGNNYGCEAVNEEEVKKFSGVYEGLVNIGSNLHKYSDCLRVSFESADEYIDDFVKSIAFIVGLIEIGRESGFLSGNIKPIFLHLLDNRPVK